MSIIDLSLFSSIQLIFATLLAQGTPSTHLRNFAFAASKLFLISSKLTDIEYNYAAQRWKKQRIRTNFSPKVFINGNQEKRKKRTVKILTETGKIMCSLVSCYRLASSHTYLPTGTLFLILTCFITLHTAETARNNMSRTQFLTINESDVVGKILFGLWHGSVDSKTVMKVSFVDLQLLTHPRNILKQARKWHLVGRLHAIIWACADRQTCANTTTRSLSWDGCENPRHPIQPYSF